ncbi:serine hydrolase domain-containing protein [Qipengyuania flava]|uniref:serine hydrolase domain-containing protein n=1 Tax=Qipengyuania flava TaxID=192812 RepID=UPI001C639807|nr:serine hydrolase domain-containing protein [Qipengyuania flava]QYJ05897.1 beta-lactamase family protein [Qipengyuania flava]
MKRFLAATLLMCIAAPVQGEDDIGEFETFGSYLENFRKESGTPSLSAAIVRDGAIVWESYLGVSDDEGEFPTSPETTYYIASVTKPLAATAILMEAEAGGLDLLLPMSSDEGWERTCEWLSTSQIPFGAGGTDTFGNTIPAMDCAKRTTLEDMLDMRANGEVFVYNPIAYARIDRAIEGAGGRPLRDIVREHVADRVGMTDVALGWRDPQGGAALRYLAPPFTVTDSGPEKAPLFDDDFRAAAGILASVRDLAAFEIAYEGGELVSDAEREDLVRRELPELGDYRHGWWLSDWEGQRLQWHSGWEPGKYSAMYLKVPEQDLALIVLANTELIWWGNSVVRAGIEDSPLAKRFLETFAR